MSDWGQELASASFPTLLRTTNGVSFVGERFVFWGDAAWTDGHVSLGETSVGFLKWAPTCC